MLSLVQLQLFVDLLGQDSFTPLAAILHTDREAAEQQLASGRL